MLTFKVYSNSEQKYPTIYKCTEFSAILNRELKIKNNKTLIKKKEKIFNMNVKN